MYTFNSPSQYGGFIFRQVSRSPHSKHSQRRHSPYSSLDVSRFVAIKFSVIMIYVFETNYHHHIRISHAGEFVRLLKIHLLVLPCLLLFLLNAEEGDRDPGHLFDGKGDKLKRQIKTWTGIYKILPMRTEIWRV